MAAGLRLKQKLIFKISILFLIPMISQFLLGSILFHMSSQSEELSRIEHRLDSVNEASTREFALFAMVLVNMIKFEKSQKFQYLGAAKDQFYRLRLAVDRDDDPILANHLLVMQQMMTAELIKQRSADGAGLRGGAIPEEDFEPFFKEIDQTAGYWIKKMETARTNQSDARRTNEMNRQNTRFLVGVLFPVTTTMALLLLLVFMRSSVSRRLELVVENAHRLPMGVPLEPQLEGTDEISYLDGVLHQSETYLKEATEQRTLIMEMVAHDMRSPLMSAQIANDLAMRLTETKTDAQEKNFSAVKRNLSVVINLLDELLTIDRLESGALELTKSKFELRPLVEEATENLYALSNSRQITLKNDCQADLRGSIDKDRILQVLTNLISNSIKFSPNGSTITISSQESDRFVQICVADQGSGLPPGSEKNVFDKFHQTDKRHAKRGFGLGLTICKMLIELHNGTISASNNPDGGARFCFSVPKAKQFDG